MTLALEIIHLRCSAPSVNEAETVISELLPALFNAEVRLYRSAIVSNDLSIHLVHRSNSPERAAPSEAVVEVTKALEGLGRVHHTTWIQADLHFQNEGSTS
ncbi:MAG: hypothetical protein AAGG01_07585 [Planctomycetota bacterium]